MKYCNLEFEVYKNNIKNASTAEEQAWCHTRH